MTISIVRLGSARARNEGLRIGTVRRPPRGIPKNQFATKNWYDVWYPNLAPSVELMKFGQAASTDREWGAFVRRYRSEMTQADKRKTLDLLAALSQQNNFSVGCYCEDESHCHRSVSRGLLLEHGAKVR